MRPIIRAAAILILLAGLTGCGQPAVQEFQPLGQSIINGEPDPSDAHLAVVYLRIIDGGAMYACTGTLITRDVVLTAGHCVDATSLSAYRVYFTPSTIYSPSAESRTVSERLRHPDYDGRMVLNDIALLRLSEPAPAGIRPIPPLPANLGIGTIDVGTPIEFVGFGLDEDGDTGTKLHVFGKVRYICDSEDVPAGYVCGFTDDIFGNPGTLCFDQSEGGTCQGDSGGPALIVREGSEYVAGITSYGDRQGCTVYGCSTKVDDFEDFILGFTGGGLGEACTLAEQCAHGFCVDGVCCESACDQPCRACNLSGQVGRCKDEANGAPCSDGDLCNGEEICLVGECVPGQALDCDDGDVCTTDGCLPQTGCLNEPQPEGYACGDCMMCRSGACVKANCSSGCSLAGDPARPADGRSGQSFFWSLSVLLALALLIRRAA